MWLLKIRRLAKEIGREALILLFAVRDPATPMPLKAASVAALAYLFSPIDLVPDIPVVGWVDDLLVISLGFPYLIRKLPPAVYLRASNRADRLLASLGVEPKPSKASAHATKSATVRAKKPAATRARKTATARAKKPTTAPAKKPATARTKKPATARAKKPATAPAKKAATARTKKPATARAKKPATAGTKTAATSRARRPAPPSISDARILSETPRTP